MSRQCPFEGLNFLLGRLRTAQPMGSFKCFTNSTQTWAILCLVDSGFWPNLFWRYEYNMLTNVGGIYHRTKMWTKTPAWSCLSRSSSKWHITDSKSCLWSTSLPFTRYGLAKKLHGDTCSKMIGETSPQKKNIETHRNPWSCSDFQRFPTDQENGLKHNKQIPSHKKMLRIPGLMKSSRVSSLTWPSWNLDPTSCTSNPTISCLGHYLAEELDHHMERHLKVAAKWFHWS